MLYLQRKQPRLFEKIKDLSSYDIGDKKFYHTSTSLLPGEKQIVLSQIHIPMFEHTEWYTIIWW